MSKKTPRSVKYTPEHHLPKLKKIVTEWDLKRHFYRSERDPRIEDDLTKAERAYAAFAKKYGSGDVTRSPKRLLAALKDYEKLGSLRAAEAPSLYFAYRSVLNAHDTVAQKKLNLIGDRLTKAGNRVLFFEVALGKIPKKRQQQLLRDPKFKKYRYSLQRVFLEARHVLSEAEEKILNLKSDVAYGLWVDGTDKIYKKRSITYKGESIPLPAATERLDTFKESEKPKVWKCITDELRDLAEIGENEMNAVVLNKKINDELRKYPHSYSATIMGYENDERSVLALVDAISKKGFGLSRRYYARKAKLKGVRSFPYSNRSDHIGADIPVSFETATTICRDTFYDVNDEYGKIFDRMLQNGQIDVYPKAGKSGGAFCSGAENMPTFVLLNNVGKHRSMTTLAHEMGHAIHTERSKKQPFVYQGYSTTTAETASTLFEGLANDRFLRTLPESAQVSVLDRRISDAIATIMRQVAFFNYELELHETVRREGALTWQEMAQLLQKHLRSYMGPAVEITEADGLSFVYIGHFRNFFYVYSYAYGELMSSILRENFYKDRAFAKQIDTFLTAGSSDTVENIFASIGINARKTDTFLKSLAGLENDIALFEKLTK